MIISHLRALLIFSITVISYFTGPVPFTAFQRISIDPLPAVAAPVGDDVIDLDASNTDIVPDVS